MYYFITLYHIYYYLSFGNQKGRSWNTVYMIIGKINVK